MQNRVWGELEDFLLKFQKAKWRKLFIMQCLLSDDKTDMTALQSVHSMSWTAISNLLEKSLERLFSEQT